ncbi:MAG: DUF4097 family beta strand repeat protein [Acidobacteria bacterium]|nr:DUF4097 family beta strand repeat protein [Acidobacteriota bacterium]MCB9397775.1 DUF4097 family beta strand repeat protein [Acidobacteriota bacterium]
MILFVLLLWAGQGDSSKNFDMKPGSRFYLDTHKGHIQVVPSKDATCHVVARMVREPGVTYREATVQMKQFGGDVEVSVEYDDDHSGWFDDRDLVPVEFEIALPDFVKLKIDDHKSTFDITCPRAEVKIDTHKGEGEIRGIMAPFELDTHKGTFKIQVVSLADFTIDTHKGDIEVTIQEAHDFSLAAESHKGDFRFKGRSVHADDDEDESYAYREGSGANRVRLSTHKGRIHLNFLDGK